MKAIKQSIRGSIAVEAAMIVPIVIIVVMIMLYIMLIIFQTCIMQTTANNISEKAAMIYYNNKASYSNGQITKSNIESLGLYRRWTNNDFEQSSFKAVSLNQLQKNSVLKSKSSSLDIVQSGNIVNKKIIVVLESTYDNPMGILTAGWGLNKKINLKVQAEAAIDDPAEFIRNADFIIETAAKVPIINDFEGKWQEIVDQIISYINKLMKE